MKTVASNLVLFIFLCMTLVLARQNNRETIHFSPISHATFVIETTGTCIYVDAVGESNLYEKFAEADIILITHTHRDHLSPETIGSLKTDKTIIVGPQTVIDELGYGTVLNNGETKQIGSVMIEAIPMYNLTKERQKFHPQGQGNGYVITLDDKRIYISGDTEDIPEMRELKDIDYAFICMNLPYTMTVEQAASAVLEMKPGVVIPYHYRGTDGFSDIEKFKELVISKDRDIEVKLLHWYD